MLTLASVPASNDSKRKNLASWLSC